MEQANMPISFVLKGIKIEQFAFFEENYTTTKDVALSTAIDLKLDTANTQIGVFLSIAFLQSEKVLIKIDVSCHFKVDEISWQYFKQSDLKIIIPQDFAAHLASITIGTTRGILFAKIEGTIFSKFIIPTINIKDIVSEDAIFDIPKKG